MRERTSYIPRGGSHIRGREGYNHNSSNNVTTRTQNSYRQHDSNRYNSGSNNDHYDNRNRDKLSNHSSMRRSSSAQKRSYDSSRDRSADRKRSRQDNYRRTSSSNDRRSSSSSISHHQRNSTRGGEVSSSLNRSSRDSGSVKGQRDSSMGPPKRTLLSAQRSVRGIGGIRIIRTRNTEANNIRRQLAYVRQKDRVRVLKIQKLKSSLRRQRKEGEECDDLSGDPDTAQKKKNRKVDDEGEGGEDNDDKLEGNDEKSETITKSPKKGCSSKSEDSEGKTKSGRKTESGNGAKQRDVKVDDSEKDQSKGKIDRNSDSDKAKEKSKSSSSTVKRSNDKKNKESDGSKIESKSKESSSDKERSLRKDKDNRVGNRNGRRSSSHHHDDEVRNRNFIKLICVHCRFTCLTYKEYIYHLHSRKHNASIHAVILRQRCNLKHLRYRQRTLQREIEDKSKEKHEPRYCRICRLAYQQPKDVHQSSEYHKTIKKIVMPYCRYCHLAFKDSIQYETHRSSLEHIKNKAFSDESGSEDSASERDIDLNTFLTLDSVGEIDSGIVDAAVDAMLLEAKAAQKSTDEETRKRGLIGYDFIKPIEAFYCKLCNIYLPKGANDTLEIYSNFHCLDVSHVNNYLRHKDETEKFGNTTNAIEEPKKKEIDVTDSNGTKPIVIDGGDDYENKDPKISVEDKLWEEVDKDLGDLLAPSEPLVHEEDEDECVLNIDIESEKKDAKIEPNVNTDETLKAGNTSKDKSLPKNVSAESVSTSNGDIPITKRMSAALKSRPPLKKQNVSVNVKCIKNAATNLAGKPK